MDVIRADRTGTLPQVPLPALGAPAPAPIPEHVARHLTAQIRADVAELTDPARAKAVVALAPTFAGTWVQLTATAAGGTT
jgi:hypothetical protein